MGILDDVLGDVDTSAPQSDYPVIPKGTYTAKLVEASLDTKGTSNAPVVDLVFKITSGDFEGRKLWQTVWFNEPETEGRKINMAISMRALAVPKSCNSDDWNKLAENVCGHLQQYVDKQTFKVQVWGHREYNGKFYEQSSVQEMFNESEVHAGVKNHAPTFDQNEEIPF